MFLLQTCLCLSLIHLCLFNYEFISFLIREKNVYYQKNLVIQQQNAWQINTNSFSHYKNKFSMMLVLAYKFILHVCENFSTLSNVMGYRGE